MDLCYECGCQYGRKAPDEGSTWWDGTCGICHQGGTVTDERDFGYIRKFKPQCLNCGRAKANLAGTDYFCPACDLANLRVAEAQKEVLNKLREWRLGGIPGVVDRELELMAADEALERLEKEIRAKQHF